MVDTAHCVYGDHSDILSAGTNHARRPGWTAMPNLVCASHAQALDGEGCWIIEPLGVAILRAILNGDETGAIEYLDGMTADARRSLLAAARRLVFLADDHNRCRGCGKPVERLAGVPDILKLGAWCGSCPRPMPSGFSPAQRGAWEIIRSTDDAAE